MVLVTMRPRPSRRGQELSTNFEPAVKIMLQVTQIASVRFLLEGGLRFRNLGFCGHDLMETATFKAP